MKRACLAIVFVCLYAGTALPYTISGRLGNISACYHPRVYLEVIRDIDGFYGANAHNLLASADVAPDGTFSSAGGDLPAEKMFYRLYATTSATVKTSIRNGPNPNFILLALDNATDETILCNDFCSASANYTAATHDNRLLAQMSRLQSEYFIEASGELSESKKEFLIAAFKKEMLGIADTSQNIAAFYAAFLAEVSGLDLSRIAANAKNRFPESAYTAQLAKKAELDKLPSSAAQSIRFNVILSVLLVVSLIANLFLLLRRKKSLNDNTAMEQQAKELIETLSIKEREILKMVHEGLSNKEIADRHNIEVSTVKTHVSRIYQKTGIRSRKEVASIARYA